MVEVAQLDPRTVVVRHDATDRSVRGGAARFSIEGDRWTTESIMPIFPWSTACPRLTDLRRVPASNLLQLYAVASRGGTAMTQKDSTRWPLTCPESGDPTFIELPLDVEPGRTGAAMRTQASLCVPVRRAHRGNARSSQREGMNDTSNAGNLRGIPGDASWATRTEPRSHPSRVRAPVGASCFGARCRAVWSTPRSSQAPRRVRRLPGAHATPGKGGGETKA